LKYPQISNSYGLVAIMTEMQTDDQVWSMGWLSHWSSDRPTYRICPYPPMAWHTLLYHRLGQKVR